MGAAQNKTVSLSNPLLPQAMPANFEPIGASIAIWQNQHMPAVILSFDGNIHRMNPACQSLLGNPSEKNGIGISFWDVFPISERIDAVRPVWKAHRQGLFPQNYIAEFNAGGEAYTVIKWSFTIVQENPSEPAQVFGFGIDITDHRVVEQKLEKSESQYKAQYVVAQSLRSIMNSMGNGIALLDYTNNRTFVNATAALTMGIGLDQLTPQLWSATYGLYRVDDLPFTFQQGGDPILSGMQSNVTDEIEVFVKNDEVRDGMWVGVTSRPLRKSMSGFDGDVLVMKDITERKNYEENISKSLTEKETLLKEIHHRVKNNLQIIASLLMMQSLHIEDEGTLDMMDASQNRIRSMALIHEKLYQSPDLSSIDLGSYLAELTNHLLFSFHGEDIETTINTVEIFVNIESATPCGLIVNEIVSNMLKYAFPERESNTLLLELKIEDDELVLIAADNGPGLPDDFETRKTKSLGMQLVEDLTMQLRGTLDIDSSDKGTRFALRFKELDYQARI